MKRNKGIAIVSFLIVLDIINMILLVETLYLPVSEGALVCDLLRGIRCEPPCADYRDLARASGIVIAAVAMAPLALVH